MKTVQFNCKILHSNGDGSPAGYYWRMELAPNRYGPAHGPFATEEFAQGNFVDFLSSEMAKLSRQSGRQI